MRRVAASCALLLALTGCGVGAPPTASGGIAPPVSVSAPAAQVPEPTTLTIPTIGVTGRLEPLGLNPDGTLEVPPLNRPQELGWYARGVRPGSVGPAVLVSHVDAYGRPGGFYRLHELTSGALVTIGRADTTTATFRVTRVDTVPKDQFPSAAVYGDTPGPELRLITCGGGLDADRHSYRDNIIAYATLV